MKENIFFCASRMMKVNESFLPICEKLANRRAGLSYFVGHMTKSPLFITFSSSNLGKVLQNLLEHQILVPSGGYVHSLKITYLHYLPPHHPCELLSPPLHLAWESIVQIFGKWSTGVSLMMQTCMYKRLEGQVGKVCLHVHCCFMVTLWGTHLNTWRSTVLMKKNCVESFYCFLILTIAPVVQLVTASVVTYVKWIVSWEIVINIE